MTMANPNIDGGKEFDWGARIGPNMRNTETSIRRNSMTGFLHEVCAGKDSLAWTLEPVPAYCQGTCIVMVAAWTATDISENQIAQARKLSEGMQIEYYAIATEDLCFPDASF